MGLGVWGSELRVWGLGFRVSDFGLGFEFLGQDCQGVVGRKEGRAGKMQNACLVANRATIPQKWPPTTRNVAVSCELTSATNPKVAPPPGMWPIRVN